jgi:hypothetical protein
LHRKKAVRARSGSYTPLARSLLTANYVPNISFSEDEIIMKSGGTEK